MNRTRPRAGVEARDIERPCGSRVHMRFSLTIDVRDIDFMRIGRAIAADGFDLWRMSRQSMYVSIDRPSPKIAIDVRDIDCARTRPAIVAAGIDFGRKVPQSMYMFIDCALLKVAIDVRETNVGRGFSPPLLVRTCNRGRRAEATPYV